MYTINFHSYLFESEEDIQPAINQLISQASLLEYLIKFDFVEFLTSITYKIKLYKNKDGIIIRIHVDKTSNELLYIESIFLFYDEEVDRYTKDHNYSELFQTIINKL